MEMFKKLKKNCKYLSKSRQQLCRDVLYITLAPASLALEIYLVIKHWNKNDKNDFLTTEILTVSLLPINCLNIKLLLKVFF